MNNPIKKKEFPLSSNTKDWTIARQSQLKNMIEIGKSCGKCLDLKTLVGGAELLSDYVVNGYNKEIGERLVKLQEHIDNF